MYNYNKAAQISSESCDGVVAIAWLYEEIIIMATFYECNPNALILRKNMSIVPPAAGRWKETFAESVENRRPNAPVKK